MIIKICLNYAYLRAFDRWMVKLAKNGKFTSNMTFWIKNEGMIHFFFQKNLISLKNSNQDQHFKYMKHRSLKLQSSSKTSQDFLCRILGIIWERFFLNVSLILQNNFNHYHLILMPRSNFSAPIPPPGHPRGHHFLGGCPGLLITLFSPCPALYKHSNHSFFQCPALIYHTHFSSDPVADPGGG